MEMLNVNTGEYISRVYIYDASDSSCGDAAETENVLTIGGDDLRQSFFFHYSFLECM